MLIGHVVSDPDGRLLAVDAAVCEMLQRSARELVGLSYTTLTHRDDRERCVDYVARLAIFEQPARIRKRYLRPDGSHVWADVRASRMVTDGVVRLIGTLRLDSGKPLPRDPRTLWQSAGRALAAIHQRRVDLGDELFADHPWLILLQIYLAEAEGRLIAVAEIAECADLRPPLVERWLRVLGEKTLVEHGCHGHAGQLTPAGIAKVERLLATDGCADRD